MCALPDSHLDARSVLHGRTEHGLRRRGGDTETDRGVVLEIDFADEAGWERFRASTAVQAALDAVPDRFSGLLIYRGKGGSSAPRMPRKPRLDPGPGRSLWSFPTSGRSNRQQSPRRSPKSRPSRQPETASSRQTQTLWGRGRESVDARPTVVACAVGARGHFNLAEVSDTASSRPLGVLAGDVDHG